MSKSLTQILIFGAGIAAGVLGSRSYFKNLYMKRAEDEIESVRQAFYRQTGAMPEEKTSKKDKPTLFSGEKPKENASNAVNYGNYYDKDEQKTKLLEEEMAVKEFPKEKDEPYIISEIDYSETEIAYDKLSCTYYIPDNLVVDDLSREPVEPDTIGEANLEYLMKTTDKFVYIRNDILGCDMEISRDDTSVVETGDIVWRE